MTIKEYYEVYLSLHTNKYCRRMHVLGQLVTVCFIISVIASAVVNNSSDVVFLLVSPFIIYPFAWTGHAIFERNKPAAWSNPIKAKICDWLMLYDILRGKIKF